MTQSAHDWLASFAAEAGIAPPTEEELGTLLELTSIAAHASERIAGPITCWLVGQARLDPAAALAIGKRLAANGAATGD